MDLFGSTIDVLSKAMDLRMINNRVIASNLANVDTPGYQAQRMDFEASIQRAIAQIEPAGSGNFGADGEGSEMQNPGIIRSIAADITVDAHATTGDGESRLVVAGSYYNAGTAGGGPGSETGNVVASVGSDSTGAYFNVFKFTSENFVNLTNSGSPVAAGLLDRIYLGAITLGVPHTVYVDWDGSVFTFQLNNDPPVTFDPVAAGAPVAGPPNDFFGGLIWLNSNAAGGSAYIKGSIDNVRTR